jgi:hemolysin III
MYKGERFNSITHLVGAPLILYLFSTLYHSLRGKAKAVFRKLDHAAIYLLIAGTYTPLTLVTLRGGWGWSLFGAVWGLAIFGIVLDSLPRKGRRILPIVVYLLMGWLVVIALRPLVRALPVGGIVWVVAGGLLYTSGIAFYIADKRIRHAHGVWHLFVLAGSATHYLAILLYLV